MRIWTSSLLLAWTALSTGCAHTSLSGSDLRGVHHPAFISRVEDGAGPRSRVFRDDASYGPSLKRLEPAEGDRRLSDKLGKMLTRFEIAERLRATTVSKLPHERPWSEAVGPAVVAQVLQTFLVEEIPAKAPDYRQVAALGADAVVEFVIEEFGTRSQGGKTGAYMLGYGRMFRPDGGELWSRRFRVDTLEAGLPGVDPFKLAKDVGMWRHLMEEMLDGVAMQFARDLSPSDGLVPVTPIDEAEVKAQPAAPVQKPAAAAAASEEDPL
jgi:hypothetical protein